MTAMRQRLPRSFWILLILVAVAGGALFWNGRRDGADRRYVRGGPLLPFPADRIEGLLLTDRQGQFRFDRSPDGVWSLSGAVSDYVAQNRLQRLVEDLAAAAGGPVIPGSEPEDRRYGFNASEALRLTIRADDGRQQRLALGVANPVSGRYYASGADRGASFTVDAELRDQLVALPASMQLDVLLPLDDRDRVSGVELWVRDAGYRLRRRDDRWWIRPLAGDEPLPSLVTAYQSRYADRRLTDPEGIWYAADFVHVDGLIYDVSAPLVRGIPPLAEAGALRVETGLDRPAWRVVLLGDGIDRDPLGDDPDRLALSLAFGTVSGVPVLRRENVLLADSGALRTLDRGPGYLFDVGGLPFRLATADSLHLDGPDGPVIWAAPGPRGWRSQPPPGLTFRDTSARAGHEAAELVADLDRMPLLAVLPPSRDRGVLSDDQRLRLSVGFAGGPAGPAQERVVEFGLLAEEWLPDGSRLVDFPDDDLPPTGIWEPATGRLLQVPGYVIITGRNFRDNYRPVD